MFAPTTQTLSNLLKQLKQLCTTNTKSHSTSTHHKGITTIQIDIDINIIKGTQNTKAMVIITETNHTVETHTTEHITVDTTTDQGLMK